MRGALWIKKWDVTLNFLMGTWFIIYLNLFLLRYLLLFYNFILPNVVVF